MKLKITEEFWGVDRRSGKGGTKKTDEITAECAPGAELIFEKGRRRFVIDEVSGESVTFSVRYADEKYNKTWTIPKGEGAFYRPLSMDGGYQYIFKVK